jgi:phage terminase large subunit
VSQIFKQTTAQAKIARLRKRVRGVKGGTSASKTFSIIPLLIEYASLKPKMEISIVSESIPHLRRGAMRDFEKIMVMTDNFVDARFNRSNLTYKFANGSYIEFFSADQSDKLRGARRDVLFINECNNINFEAYQQMAIRTRNFIYLDWNPTHEFWFNTELEGDSDTDTITLTYLDNEALEPSIVKEIEKAKEKAKNSSYWANWWNVYGLGLQGVIEGIVYPDWKIIDKLPIEARLLGTGLDFGFTNDPTAAIDVYKLDDGYILDEVLYRKGLHNNEIYALLKDKRNVYADSAEPKSISELRRYGLGVRGAVKGKDSIMFGVQILQSNKIFVTSQSTNLIKEMRNYSFDKDRAGNTLNKPIDAFNHCMDAARYAASELIGNKNQGKYRIARV